MSRARPKVCERAALCFAIFFMLIYVPFLGAHLNTRKNDFNAVYIWSAAARKGMNPYVDDLTRLESQLGIDDNGNHHAVYPPPLIVAFEPITLLPPITAYWIWFGVSLFALMASFGLLLGREAFLFALLALFYEPLTDHFLWAQSYTVVLLLLAVSIRAMTNGRHTVAGVSVAIAGALKIFPLVILLYFVRTRRWRVVFSAAVGLFTISALTTGLMGWNRISLVPGVVLTRSLGALGVYSFERFDWRDDCAIGAPIDGNRFAGRPSTVVAIDFRSFGARAWRGGVLDDPGERSRSESIRLVDHSGDLDVPYLLAGSHGAVPSVSWGFVLQQKSRLAPGKMGRGFQLCVGSDAASDSLDTFDCRPYCLASSGGKNLPCHVGAKLFLFSLAVFPARDSTRGHETRL